MEYVGGCSLDTHHGYVVEYGTDRDVQLVGGASSSLILHSPLSMVKTMDLESLCNWFSQMMELSSPHYLQMVDDLIFCEERPWFHKSEIEYQIIQLSNQDAEEEPWEFDETIDPNQISYVKCLVGTFLTTSIIFMDSIKKTLVNLWHLIGRFYLNDLPNKRFLLSFFLDVDVERVIDGGSWTFHNHLMIEHKLIKGDDLDVVPLDTMNRFVVSGLQLERKMLCLDEDYFTSKQPESIGTGEFIVA
ncbi:hypothetical protein ACFE04_009945 [Oxalis oulophora]